MVINHLSGWWFGTWLDYFPQKLGWWSNLTFIFFRGVKTTNQLNMGRWLWWKKFMTIPWCSSFLFIIFQPKWDFHHGGKSWTVKMKDQVKVNLNLNEVLVKIPDSRENGWESSWGPGSMMSRDYAHSSQYLLNYFGHPAWKNMFIKAAIPMFPSNMVSSECQIERMQMVATLSNGHVHQMVIYRR